MAFSLLGYQTRDTKRPSPEMVDRELCYVRTTAAYTQTLWAPEVADMTRDFDTSEMRRVENAQRTAAELVIRRVTTFPFEVDSTRTSTRPSTKAS
ncbi:hypothetical protein [Microbacterium sp. NPDC076911]|uniref:hypothetical protein n=1 Tax=Microbacterium sp. NPDC076911 TaxID=3154958 RepID=UPI003430D3A7